jgi:hypothetical protein
MRKASGVEPEEIRRIAPHDCWRFLATRDPDGSVHFGLTENVFCAYWRARFGDCAFRVNRTSVEWVDGRAQMPAWTESYALSLVNWPHGLGGAESITVARAMEVLLPFVQPGSNIELIIRTRSVKRSVLPPPNLAARLSENPLLTIAEAAQYRGVSKEAIRSAIKRGTLHVFPLDLPDDAPNRRDQRIQRSELDRYGAQADARPNLREYPTIVDRQHADGYLTIAEAAKMMDISHRRIEILCRRRVLCRFDRDGFWFVLAEDVRDLLNLRDRAAQRDPMSPY